MALAHAIAICANLGVALPKWAAGVYIASYKNLLNYHSPSWESIFGPPTPKGQQLDKLRKRHLNSFRVAYEIQRRHRDGAPIDDQMFAEVGRELGIGGATLVKDYYADEKRAMERIQDQLTRDHMKREKVARWANKQLAAANRAVNNQDLERAQKLIKAVEGRLSAEIP
jgi:hypothetical protein